MTCIIFICRVFMLKSGFKNSMPLIVLYHVNIFPVNGFGIRSILEFHNIIFKLTKHDDRWLGITYSLITSPPMCRYATDYRSFSNFQYEFRVRINSKIFCYILLIQIPIKIISVFESLNVV